MDDVFEMFGSFILSRRESLDERIGLLIPSVPDGMALEGLLGLEGIRDGALTGVRIPSISDLRKMTPRNLIMELPRLSRREIAKILGECMRAASLGTSAPAFSVDDPLVAWIADLDRGGRRILLHELCADELQRIVHRGAAQSLTPGRMQELSEVIRQQFENAVAESSDLAAVTENFDHAVAAPVLRGSLVNRLPWLEKVVPGSEINSLSVLSILRGVSVDGEWIYRGDLYQERRLTLEALGIEPDEVMSVDVSRRILSRQGRDGVNLDSWLDYCGLTNVNGQLSLRKSEVDDRASWDQPPAGNSLEGNGESSAREPGLNTFAGEVRASAEVNVNQAHGRVSDIRTWARQNGYEVADRGRIPQVIREAYDAAVDVSRSSAPQQALVASSGVVREGHSSLLSELDSLASTLSRDDSGVTLGTILEGREQLSAHAQEIVYRILGAKLSGNSWVVDATSATEINTIDGEDGEAGCESPRRGTLKSRAWDILKETNHPLSFALLVSRMGGGVNERSLRVQLGPDPRFTRSDIDSWALAEWNLRPYTSVRELVEEEIDKAGGSVASEQLVHDLMQAFSIKESTLRQVISSHPFTARGGSVRRLSDSVQGEDEYRASGQQERVAGETVGGELARDLGLDF
ncbi:histone-like nucleoid-structuring protein Lsr2 [Streptomyces sp. NPDC058545]|uniref:Lsr2 family DNA-binding protein n=1 Tax=Streptomyces sp. NPDC058545 TaxID=3346544 RepID=UPI003661DA3B